MAKKLVLVGCGNVGSWHLQALARLPYEISVDIVEPNMNAQKLAKSRLGEISYEKNHSFFWHESLNELVDESDLVIVATTAVGRVNLINQLLEKGHSRFLVEKVVCQSAEEYDFLLSKMKKFNAKGWVNTNSRYLQAYQKIKEYFQNSKMIHFSVIGPGHYGLGTNAIHYLDLFSWITVDYKIKLNGEFIFNELFPNKRGEHLLEFAGTITGSLQNGSTCVVTFVPNTNLPAIVNIVGDDKHLLIDETKERVLNLMNQDDHSFEYKSEYVSTLTTRIVTDILEKNNCLLPTIDNLYHHHCELFRILNSHIKKITNEERKLCPIT